MSATMTIMSRTGDAAPVAGFTALLRIRELLIGGDLVRAALLAALALPALSVPVLSILLVVAVLVGTP